MTAKARHALFWRAVESEHVVVVPIGDYPQGETGPQCGLLFVARVPEVGEVKGLVLPQNHVHLVVGLSHSDLFQPAREDDFGSLSALRLSALSQHTQKSLSLARNEVAPAFGALRRLRKDEPREVGNSLGKSQHSTRGNRLSRN